jgi:hypothetical protein
MSGPLDEASSVPAVGHPLCCLIPRSIRSGWLRLTDGFSLRTLSYCRPTTIMGLILDTFTISCDVLGMSCKELERLVIMGLLCPFTVPVWACRFTSSIVTLRGIKASNHPYANLHPLTQTLVASSHPSLCLKRKRGREIDLEIGGKFVEVTWRRFSLPSQLWQSGARSLQRLQPGVCQRTLHLPC